MSRIISSQNNLPTLEDWLPFKAIEAINLIKSNPNWAFLDYEFFEKQSNEFYRPNPTNQNISIHFPTVDEYKIQLTDIQGRILKIEKIQLKLKYQPTPP